MSNINTDAFHAGQDIYVSNNETFRKMRTLKNVINTLKHQNRVLDVLKIDTEVHEWAVLENLMESDVFRCVRQIMTEFHIFPDWPKKVDYVRLYQIYNRFREMGFREFHIGPYNLRLKKDNFNNQGESEFINYLFKKDTHNLT